MPSRHRIDPETGLPMSEEEAKRVDDAAEVAWAKHVKRTRIRLMIQYPVLIGLLIWQPFWCMATYCAISYVVVIWLFASGELSDPPARSMFWRVVTTGLAILLAPLFFAFFVLFFALRAPIL